ncbi:MAG: hypothetical protein ACK4WC_00195 [Rubrimonas sp.]
MEITRKEEARALDADERALVAKTHHPEVQELADAELAALVRQVRERRDRAQDIARRRRREMRGKSAPKGAEASRDDGGSRTKLAALAAAMRRLNGEASRRKRMSTRLSMAESQRRAMEMVADRKPEHARFNTRTAHEGMRVIEKTRIRRIGSAKEAGRVSQFVKNAQAKRDAR